MFVRKDLLASLEGSSHREGKKEGKALQPDFFSPLERSNEKSSI